MRCLPLRILTLSWASLALPLTACTDTPGPAGALEMFAADGLPDTPGTASPEGDLGSDPGDTSAVKPQGDTLSPDARAWLSNVSCFQSPPPGAPRAKPLPSYSGGICPTLVAGLNTITTSNVQRELLLVLPSKPKSGEVYPVIFMWYWLKGSPQSFLTKGEVQAAVDNQRFIAVIPESKKDLNLLGLVDLPWPFTTLVSQARMDEEHAFFDDMLACVGAQYSINKECVAAVGVSAGGLYVSQLAGVRSEHLSSFLSLSGGVGSGGVVNSYIRPWKEPTHKLPAMVLWGGPQDNCGLLSFQSASKQLEQELTAGGHFFVECVHNCMHDETPVEPPAGISRYEPIWDFVFKHPYWLGAGLSPYQVTGWPAAVVPWCGLGAGSSTVRTGPCDPPGCPL